MGYTAEDIEALIRRIQYNLTTVKAQVADLAQALAAVPMPSEAKTYPCAFCGLAFSSEGRLMDHRRNVHGREEAIGE